MTSERTILIGPGGWYVQFFRERDDEDNPHPAIPVPALRG